MFQMNDLTKKQPDSDDRLISHAEDSGPVCWGRPEESHLCSWKDYIAIIGCLASFTVAAVVVFNPSSAIYWGETRQFIWVGLCLTLMAWSAQFPLRRLFLVTSTNSKSASTLQSVDAILRSDPTTDLADWRIRIALGVMLGLGPALSAAYKALGGHHSHEFQENRVAQLGMTGPPGTQNLGWGLSQFVNATLPFYKDPGFPNRVYGFNMHVASENVTAMLDGPMPIYVQNIQASLRSEQSKTVTADVAALICEEVVLTESAENFGDQYDTNDDASKGEQWIRDAGVRVAIMLPNPADNTNMIIGNFNTSNNETFGSHVRQYKLSRQTYTGSWRMTKTSIELKDAIPRHEPIDDRGLLTNNSRSIHDLYKVAFAEYDWRYASSSDSPSSNIGGSHRYIDNIKSDSTLLAAMLWSRLVAADGPEVWKPGTSKGVYQGVDSHDQGWPELRYEQNVSEETSSMTIKPSWEIAIVLAINPLILMLSLITRIILWPQSPIGEGFGLVSLLASVEKGSLALLQGAGLSGKVRRRIFVGFLMNRDSDSMARIENEKVTTVLGTKAFSSGRLRRRAIYG